MERDPIGRVVVEDGLIRMQSVLLEGTGVSKLAAFEGAE